MVGLVGNTIADTFRFVHWVRSTQNRLSSWGESKGLTLGIHVRTALCAFAYLSALSSLFALSPITGVGLAVAGNALSFAADTICRRPQPLVNSYVISEEMITVTGDISSREELTREQLQPIKKVVIRHNPIGSTADTIKTGLIMVTMILAVATFSIHFNTIFKGMHFSLRNKVETAAILSIIFLPQIYLMNKTTTISQNATSELTNSWLYISKKLPKKAQQNHGRESSSTDSGVNRTGQFDDVTFLYDGRVMENIEERIKPLFNACCPVCCQVCCQTQTPTFNSEWRQD